MSRPARIPFGSRTLDTRAESAEAYCDEPTLEALLAEHRFGKFDLPCPECSPGRSAAGSRRKVLRVWRYEGGFLTYHCVRCGTKGYARTHNDTRPVKLDREHGAEADRRDSEHRRRQYDKACWLWRQSVPLGGTIAEQYLRSRRIALDCLPATLRYLPPTKPEHHPAMIAAFGIAQEPACGTLHIPTTAVRAVHLTLLRPDGTGKAGTDNDKIFIGSALGMPIVLAPLNDLLGLAITEGIEEALTIHEATGLGAWAAGAASRMPALAGMVPNYADCIRIIRDSDDSGRRNASVLADRLRARGLSAEIVNSSREEVEG